MNAPVAIITGASQGIGAGLVAGYRRAGYAVVGVARSLPCSHDENDYVAIAGDLTLPPALPTPPIERTCTLRSDITPGGTFPDYELPDHENVPRRLSELQGDDPMILTLARGHYCPKEHQQHLELAANYPKINVAYTQVATIATDEHHTLQEFRNSVGAQWPFLADPGRIVQKDLEIQEYTDPDNDPMIPHTIVLKPGLVVHTMYNGYWFWGRPSFVDLWHDLRDLLREIRPDWDLSTPGLREAWDAGDLSPFHGWDKRTTATESAA